MQILYTDINGKDVELNIYLIKINGFISTFQNPRLAISNLIKIKSFDPCVVIYMSGSKDLNSN